MEESRFKSELIRAVEAILRPLVRPLIAHGLTFPAFVRIAKEVYIDVARRHFALPFKRQTDSRIALVTGITRKEIGQIRRGQTMRPAAAAHLDYGLATRVIGRWMSERSCLDESGQPRDLPYEAAGRRASFVRLVTQIGGDIPPRAVLDELVRVGAVELRPDGTVRLRSRGYVPASGTAEKLAILGADVPELIAAIVHNIEAPAGEAYLQRKVYYDNIGEDAVQELRERVREAGARFVQEINTLLAAYDRDRNPAAPGGRRKRAVVGVYYFDEDFEPAEARAPERPPGRRRRA